MRHWRTKQELRQGRRFGGRRADRDPFRCKRCLGVTSLFSGPMLVFRRVVPTGFSWGGPCKRTGHR